MTRPRRCCGPRWRASRRRRTPSWSSASAVAIALLQIFEESVYQHEHAQRLRDRGRAAFLDDVLAYFTERLLLNPRLLYLWSPRGGNIRADFEPPTRAYYEAHVQIPAEARIDERPPWPTQTAGPTADRP